MSLAQEFNEAVETERDTNKMGPYKPKEMNVTDDRGPIVLEDKSMYKGEWNENIKEGLGIRVWEDGKKYQGYWKDNKANGKGRLV